MLGFHTSSAPARLVSASENSLRLEEPLDASLVDELGVSSLAVEFTCWREPQLLSPA